MAYMFATRLMLYGGDVPWLNDLHRALRPTQTYFLMDGQPAHYMIEKIDPTTVEETRNARMGFALIMMGLFLIVFGGVLFLPKRVSKREMEVKLRRDKQAAKERSSASRLRCALCCEN